MLESAGFRRANARVGTGSGPTPEPAVQGRQPEEDPMAKGNNAQKKDVKKPKKDAKAAPKDAGSPFKDVKRK